jgi:putative transposase
MRKEHVKLKEQERRSLTILTTSGELKARKFKRAMALLLLDQGKTLTGVSKTLSYAYPSLIQLKKNYLENGLKCLEEKPRKGRPSVFDGTERAKLTALACSETPSGYAQWSLRLLAEKAVELEIVPSISYSKVRDILKKTYFNRT